MPWPPRIRYSQLASRQHRTSNDYGAKDSRWTGYPRIPESGDTLDRRRLSLKTYRNSDGAWVASFNRDVMLSVFTRRRNSSWSPCHKSRNPDITPLANTPVANTAKKGVQPRVDRSVSGGAVLASPVRRPATTAAWFPGTLRWQLANAVRDASAAEAAVIQGFGPRPARSDFQARCESRSSNMMTGPDRSC